MARQRTVPLTASRDVAGSVRGEAHVRTVGLTKVFDAHSAPAVRDVDLEIARGEMFGLLGPSGCGKSTTLNLLAGFLRPSEGAIRIDGAVVNDVPPHRRGVALVFQNYALFPHLTAAENIAFGLKIRRVPKPRVRERVDELLRLVGLAGSGGRYPSQLSGGQQQRVAIARALAVDPALILLDEPLSNLDARLRADMRVELKRILREAGVTVVLVTHDQSEAFAVCDRVGLMFSGELVSIDKPEHLYRFPVSRQAAEFIGEGTLLPASVVSAGEPGVVELRVEVGERRLATRAAVTRQVSIGRKGHLFVRPEFVRICPPDAAGTVLSAVVRDVAYLGETVTYSLDAGGQRVWHKTFGLGTPHRVGDPLTVTWSERDAVFLPDEGGPR